MCSSLIIFVFVDILGTIFCDKNDNEQVAWHLDKFLKIINLEPILCLVRINFIITDQVIYLNPERYIQPVLEWFNINRCQKVKTPFENQAFVRAEPSTTIVQEITHYCAVVESLMYTANGTCLNITFATTFLSQFCRNPGPDHFIALQHVRWYLRKGTSHFLVYYHTSHKGLTIMGYTDASYASSQEIISH